MTRRALPLLGWNAGRLAAIFLGIWAAVAAVSGSFVIQLVVLGIPALAAFAYWVILRPARWMPAFFLAVLLLPPLPFAGGDSGVHIAPLFAGLGLLCGVIYAREWRSWNHPFTAAFAVFAFLLLTSVCLAAFYSGWQIALGSLARVFLFALSGFVFFYTFAGPMRDGWDGLRMVRLLYWAAVAAAVFACLDFYFQFPAPAGYGDQFIYLQQGVLRRAQGLFYEASTLGNFCAFFLVMVAVSLLRPRENAPCARWALLAGGLVLSTALMFSYSRGSVVSVAIALGVLFYLRMERLRRSFVMLAVALMTVCGAVFAVHSAFPALSENYWGRLFGSFGFFSESPDKILSGRIGHWQILLDFLARTPWHAVLGIGYKTLPYSTFVGSTVVADNTYLGLLVETGVMGLAAFLAMNAVILQTGWKAMRSRNSTAPFLGEWIFCFWCGQMIQMFSGDLITYWRLWPLYFWVLGAAARHAEEAA